MKLLLPLLATASLLGADAFSSPSKALNQDTTRISSRFSTKLYTATQDKPKQSEQQKQQQNEELASTEKKETNYLNDPNSSDQDRPASAFILSSKNFQRESRSILDQIGADTGFLSNNNKGGVVPSQERLPDCLGLTLSNEGVKKREERREARGGEVETNPVARAMYSIGCFALDELFDKRPIARFWFLEIIARIPYFSYVSMLHLYESLGWWRGVQLRKVHNAEEYNELHHLLIMESLGGNAKWSDRFLGYHVSIAYYWALNALFFFSPAAAYQFMELLESHAVDTYGEFVHENEAKLKSLPAPAVAKSYYTSGDLYMFDDFQVSKSAGSRRPPCDSLYDVFKNICDDEGEHVKTMKACQDYAKVGDLVVSPHLASSSSAETQSDLNQKRQQWKDWAVSMNEMDAFESNFDPNDE